MRRVLVVEDDADTRDSLCDLLRDNGYEVSSCETVEGARSRVASDRPDVVVLDVLLPGESTVPLVSAWRALPVPLPIILMSASLNLATKVAALAGIPLLRKPFDLTHFLEEVKRAIEPAP